MENHKQKIETSIIYATANHQWFKEIRVDRGTNAAELIEISNFLQDIEELRGIESEDLFIGVYSQTVALDYLLQKNDRLEIYRPLEADPKEVRRQLALIGKTMNKR